METTREFVTLVISEFITEISATELRQRRMAGPAILSAQNGLKKHSFLMQSIIILLESQYF